MSETTTDNGQATNEAPGTPGEGLEQRVAAPVLKWEDDSGTGWLAENTAGVETQDTSDSPKVPAVFYIDKCDPHDDITVEHFVVDLEAGLLGEPPVGPFLNLEDAKEFCERRNAELVAAAQPAITDLPNSDKPSQPAEPPPAGIDADTWTDILNARRLERDAEKDVEQLKEDLKEAKDRHEAASKRLGRLLDDAERTKNGEPRLPFGKVAEGQNEGEIMPNPIQDAPPAPAEDESWRSVLIADLEPKLSAGKLKVLSEHVPPILTMGDMAAWQQQKGDFWVKDLKGFGPGGAEQYEVAATRYFEEHPREPKAPAEPPPETETAERVQSGATSGEKVQPTNQVEQALDTPAKSAVPDHLDIEEGSVVTHLEHDDGKGGKLWLHTAQRGSGHYCYSYRVELGILDHEQSWAGRFPDLASAIAAAVEDCSAWINSHDRGKDNPATARGSSGACVPG